jgi:hypothetical protein
MQQSQIILVHRQDMGEVFEIARRHFSRPQTTKIDSALDGCRLRPAVRLMPDVVRMGTCGIDLDVEFRFDIRQHFGKYSLRRRRAADVAHAHKQYFHSSPSPA